MPDNYDLILRLMRLFQLPVMYQCTMPSMHPLLDEPQSQTTVLEISISSRPANPDHRSHLYVTPHSVGTRKVRSPTVFTCPESTRMSTEAHTVHIGTLTSGATVGQLAVRTAYSIPTLANLGSDTPFRTSSMA